MEEYSIKTLVASIVQSTQKCWVHIEEKDAVKCIIEAIESGDFYKQLKRNDINGNYDSEFKYEPYKGIEILRKENEALRKLLLKATEK